MKPKNSYFVMIVQDSNRLCIDIIVCSDDMLILGLFDNVLVGWVKIILYLPNIPQHKLCPLLISFLEFNFETLIRVLEAKEKEVILVG